MRLMKLRSHYLSSTILWSALTLAVAAQSFGQVEVEVLSGVTDAPLSGVKVFLSDPDGEMKTVELVTDAAGKVTFANLEPGDYVVELRHPKLGGESAVLKVEADRTTRFRSALEEGDEPSFTVRERRQVDPRDPDEGSVTQRDREFINTQVADRSLQGVLATVPGLQRNSLGQVHARGEHKSVAFSLDGVEIPVPMASSTTQPLDPDFLGSMDVRTGSLGGFQGGQTGVVVDAETIASDKPFFEYQTRFGNLNQFENIVRAGASTENKDFSIFVGAKTFQTDLQFEAPHPELQTLNNRGTGQSYIVRMTGKTEEDTLGGTFSYTKNNYQLPQTPQNFAGGVRQDQVDSNALGLVSWKRKLDEESDFRLSMAYLQGKQRVRNNGVFTPFTTFDPAVSEELAEEGFPADPENPGAPYLPTTNLTLTQFQPRAEYIRRWGDRNEIRAGISADFIHSRQQVSLLDPGGGGGLPGGAATFAANLGRTGFFGGIYFSHTVPVTEKLTLNYGLRADRFNNGVGVNTGQISPLANLAYALDDRNVVRFSYNRSFQAPPLELDVSGQTTVLPQRVTAYELSYESQLSDTVAARAALVRKDYRDQIDIGLLVPNSNIPLFAPVNFPSASYQGIELSLNTRNPLGWNGFVSTTISEARPLAPNPFNGEQPEYNDHDQRVQIAAGVSHKWENGLSAAIDCFYGSGFPQEALGLYNSVGITPFGYNAERVSRFLTNLSVNYYPPNQGDGPEFGGGIQVLNLFDNRPLLNFLSEFSGTRFVQQRRVLLNAQMRF
jgi:outer membrane receptor protein involved in Fe transport